MIMYDQTPMVRLLARVAQARGTALSLEAALSRACDAAMSGRWSEADSMLRTARMLAPHLEVVIGRSWNPMDVFWGAADVFETEGANVYASYQVEA